MASKLILALSAAAVLLASAALAEDDEDGFVTIEWVKLCRNKCTKIYFKNLSPLQHPPGQDPWRHRPQVKGRERVRSLQGDSIRGAAGGGAQIQVRIDNFPQQKKLWMERVTVATTAAAAAATALAALMPVLLLPALLLLLQ